MEVVGSIPNAADPNAMIKALSVMMFNYSITTNQLNSSKVILILGLPDFQWTVEYSEFLASPKNQALKISVENKLKKLKGLRFTLPALSIVEAKQMGLGAMACCR